MHSTSTRTSSESPSRPSGFVLAVSALLLLAGAAVPALAQLDVDQHEGGILEPVTTELNRRAGMPDPVVRVPNTDQSVDGVEQSTVQGPMVFEDAYAGGVLSMLGHEIDHVASPNDDMRQALADLAAAAQAGNQPAMQAAAQELEDVLLGTTQGRIYDGFSMLNFNRWKHPDIGPADFPPTAVPEEYKMKVVRDTGETFVSPFDGEVRKIWEADVHMLYYDGQIDSDTFLLHFPVDVHPDDTVRLNYRIFSLVEEDFSPTLVMLDHREALNTVNFPFKGFDAVWIAFFPGQVLNVTVNYPPARMVRGVYTWGWRVHPPRIQFLQPTYEIIDQNTGEVVLDPQSKSFIFRNREDLTLDTISDAAPEMKMYQVAEAVLDGASPATIEQWLTLPDQGPRGMWFEWADLAKTQTQIPPEAWDLLADEGLALGDFGEYNMISIFMNNEMYGDGPFGNEIRTWQQGDSFKVKLINLDEHTHYFRNVDFGARLHDDILRCCGGGETSFEIMNFKPSYGAPKVAEMQWRAGWGFRPHYDVIQQDGVFSRGFDRVKVAPYTGGEGGTFFGYQYSEEARGGDFRFNPPNFIIGLDTENPSTFRLKDFDGEDGLVIGQFTEGYGVAQMCPDDPFPGFCQTDFGPFNPNGARNWPDPTDPTVPKTELRYPPFLRNPSQGQAGAGDIIPPTGAWRPFLWLNPYNGSIYIDPDDPSKGHWADLTYSHGAPVFAGQTRTATVELPRASAQVFYQFDDLFHDNSIFSPHPVFAGFGGQDEVDAVTGVNVTFRNNSVRVKGRVTELSNGQFASWVSVYSGAMDEDGCTGTLMGTARVNEDSGLFVFHGQMGGLLPGAKVCVQSTVGGFGEGTVGQ